MKRGDIYIHNKTDNRYRVSQVLGVKLFRWWFWFVLYSLPTKGLVFVRTMRQFDRKFTRLELEE